jgi:hypothetical protein
VAAADTDTYAVAFDALALSFGVYTTAVPIATNDPARPAATLFAVMNVTSAPDIDVPAGSVALADRFLGGSASAQVRVYNRGVQVLTGAAAIADTVFAVSPSPVSLVPGTSALYTVTFTPAQTGPATGTLRFTTNDPDEATLDVPLSGAGLDPAWFSAIPGSLRVAMRPDQFATMPVTLQNVGNSAASLLALVEVEGAGAATPAVASGSLVFFDDFEDGNFDSWTAAAGTSIKEVTDESAAAGSARSFRERNAAAGHYTGIYREFDAIRPQSLSFWVQTSTAGANAAYVALRDGALRDVAFFYAAGAGNFYCNADVGGNNAYPYELDRWYHIELRDFDFAAKTFDYVVDDSLVQADIPLRNASVVTEISRVDLYSHTAGATAWWDEVLISYVPESWLTVDPYAVTATPGAHAAIEARFTSYGLADGVYNGAIHIEGNHPDNPVRVLSVPVVLTIDSAATAVADEKPPPRAFALAQNVPNPFNPTTTIAYDLPAAAEVTLAIFDVSGRRVRVLVRGTQPAGRYKAQWSGTDDGGRRVASGVYFCRLTAGAHRATRKMVLLK